MKTMISKYNEAQEIAARNVAIKKSHHPCACGCGTLIPLKDKRGRNTVFVIGHARKGRKQSQYTKQKLREHNLGKKHTLEHRRKVADAQRGRKLSPETRKKIADAHLGQKHTLETRRKISEAKRGMKLTDETRAKMSQARRGFPNVSENTKKGPTNIHSKTGYLRDSSGRIWHFNNLTNFVRENANLFSPEDVTWKADNKGRLTWCRARNGLMSLFSNGKKTHGTWKGWTVAFSIMERAEGGGDLLGRDYATVVELAK
jgi:hypothetical protein